MRNNQERLAREWAENFKANLLYDPTMDELVAASEHILATTAPPTMADVEWDGDKHFLAGATLNEGDSAKEVVMCGFTRDGEIYVVEPNPGLGKRGYWPMPDDLTPNGKRYELQDMTDEPEHPEVLCTVEDYENAPEGTIVDMPYVADVWVKAGDKWKQGEYNHRSSGYLVGTERIVLRWGWGE